MKYSQKQLRSKYKKLQLHFPYGYVSFEGEGQVIEIGIYWQKLQMSYNRFKNLLPRTADPRRGTDDSGPAPPHRGE